MTCRALALVLATALAAAPGCAAVMAPPSQTEFGPALISNGGHTSTGVRFATGAHWASSTARNPRTDVGLGYVYERTGTRPEVGPDGAALRFVEPGPQEDRVRTAQGGYLDVARRILGGERHRAWLGLRGEALWSGKNQPDLGIAARLSWELHTMGKGAGGFSDRCGGGFGVAAGTTAIGGYLETGYRVTPEGVTELVSTAGVSVRLPFFAGVAYNLCPK